MKMSDTDFGPAKATARAVSSAHQVDFVKGNHNENPKSPSTGQSREDFDAKPTEQTRPHSQPINVKVHGEELIKVLQHQLEYYFSRTNLAKDSYLISQMDSQQYVAIKTIANFNAIKKLTSDLGLVLKALRGSSMVQVDEKGEKVRPKQRRCIIILREIPDNVERSQVMALFDGASVKYSSCEFAGNGNWYVLFETEDDAQAAYCHLRENVKEFMGKPIMARIKLKTHHLNTYSYHQPQRTSQSQDAPNIKPDLPTSAPGAYVTPQVTCAPLEYFQSQQILFYSQPPFTTTAHPGTSLPPNPFITQVAIPNPASAASSGVAPHLAVGNTSLGSFVLAPWHGASLYPPQDPSTMRTPQVAHQSLRPPHDSSQAPHHRRAHADNIKSSNSMSNRNTQNQHKSPSAPQLQLPHSSMTQPHYVLSTDRIPPNFDALSHYVQSDPLAAHHLIPPMPGYRVPHFIPAIKPRGPTIVSPNDPAYVATLPHRYMQNHNPVRPQSVQVLRRTNNSRAYPSDYQRGGSTYAGDRQVRRTDVHRPPNHSYQSEVSPRFLQRGGGREYGHQASATILSSTAPAAQAYHHYNDNTPKPLRDAATSSSADNITATRSSSLDNTSFDLESSSFPPLPVAPEQLQDHVTEHDGSLPTSQGRSDVPIASVNVPHQSQSKPASGSAATGTGQSDAGSRSNSAPNVQLLSSLIATTSAKPQTQRVESSEAAGNHHEEVAKQPNTSRQITTSANHMTTSVTTNKLLTTSASTRIDLKQPLSAPVQKVVLPSPGVVNSDKKTVVDVSTTTKVKEMTETEEIDGQECSLVSNESRPTYAAMLKLQNAVADMNGKVSSDSSKSDADDFGKSDDDCRESDAKDLIETESDPKLAAKRTEDLGNLSENPAGLANGKPRRNNFDHRPGSWHNRKRADRSDGSNRFRGNRSDGWGYTGEKRNVPQEFRGRGRGTSRGGFRSHRERQYFAGKGTSGPATNEQGPFQR